MENNITRENGKTAAIISYFTIIGWLIAYFALHKNQKTALASFHLRQTLLFAIVSLIVGWGVGFILGILILSTGIGALLYIMYAFYLVLTIIWVIGLIGAIKGQQKPMPIIGEKAQTMFASI